MQPKLQEPTIYMDELTCFYAYMAAWNSAASLYYSRGGGLGRARCGARHTSRRPLNPSYSSVQSSSRVRESGDAASWEDERQLRRGVGVSARLVLFCVLNLDPNFPIWPSPPLSPNPPIPIPISSADDGCRDVRRAREDWVRWGGRRAAAAASAPARRRRDQPPGPRGACERAVAHAQARSAGRAEAEAGWAEWHNSSAGVQHQASTASKPTENPTDSTFVKFNQSLVLDYWSICFIDSTCIIYLYSVL